MMAERSLLKQQQELEKRKLEVNAADEELELEKNVPQSYVSTERNEQLDTEGRINTAIHVSTERNEQHDDNGSMCYDATTERNEQRDTEGKRFMFLRNVTNNVISTYTGYPILERNMFSSLLTTQLEQHKEMLSSHQEMAAAMRLPQPKVPVLFKVDVVIEYRAFIMAFDSRTKSKTSSNADLLYYLYQHLVGEPSDLIEGCLHLDTNDGYDEARQLLVKEFGDAYKVSMAYTTQLRQWPSVNIRQRCAKFSDLASIIEQSAETSNDPVHSKEALLKLDEKSKNSPEHVPAKKAALHSSRTRIAKSFATSPCTSSNSEHGAGSADQTKRYKCSLCEKFHDLGECLDFLKKTLEERKKFLSESHLCFACYGMNHQSKGCTNQKTCKECNKSHPTTLHIDDFNAREHLSNSKQGKSKEHITSVSSTCTDINDRQSLVLQAILPVKVTSENGKTVITYVLYKIPKLMPDLEIGVLVGSDCPLALEPLEVMPSGGTGPFAMCLRQGWTLNGPVHFSLQSNNVCHTNVITIKEHESSKEIMAPQAILCMFELDFNDLGTSSDAPSLSKEDEKFMKIVSEGVSSPSCAKFALRSACSDNETEQDSQGINTIRNNYVDACLRSVEDKSSAIEQVKNVKQICAKGGFNLTKFVCNDREVLESIPKEQRSKDVKTLDLQHDVLPLERALGVQWCVESDKLGFCVTISEKPLTRRGILSSVASIYDPLGIVAPFTLVAKKLLQDLCREKSIGWDT
ncbi:hypothetical protein AC249_AIPGENE11244 [Exaiptasia diaphana]|nr:hypothetical protein AC249_AIPGENE11244 [Exaiptasia diaphana]